MLRHNTSAHASDEVGDADPLRGSALARQGSIHYEELTAMSVNFVGVGGWGYRHVFALDFCWMENEGWQWRDLRNT